jgi:hypothetical protein
VSQIIRTFRVGTAPEELMSILDERAIDILTVEPDSEDADSRDLSWSTHEVRRGRIHLTSEEPGSTMVRISVTTGQDVDPEEILSEVVERLGDALPDGHGLDRPAIILEQEPDQPPEAETEKEQPL